MAENIISPTTSVDACCCPPNYCCVPVIGPNGNWFINGIDTGKPSQGPKGDMGVTGTQGVRGATGERGQIGPEGPTGIRGPQGAPGPQGEVGDRGIQGIQGDQGPRGYTGEPGTPGRPGTKGETGPAGPKGAPGPKGADGAKGPAGATGPAGPKGDPFTYADFTPAQIEVLQKPATDAANTVIAIGEDVQNIGNVTEQQGAVAERQGREALAKADQVIQIGNAVTEQGNIAENKGNIAETKGNDAKAKGDYAKTQGDYAKKEGANVAGTVNEIKQGLDDANAKIVQLEQGESIYNVTVKVPIPSGYYTATTARAAVPTGIRKIGMVITYQIDSKTWITEQYNTTSTSQWSNSVYWRNVSISDFNFLQFKTDPATTRISVDSKYRKQGYTLSYYNGVELIIEQYKAVDTTNSEWRVDNNWVRLVSDKELTPVSKKADEADVNVKKLIEADVVIDFKTSEYVNGKYWGQNAESKKAELIPISGYCSIASTIAVTEGQYLVLTGWGKGNTYATFGYAAYDNDDLPYNGTSSRINFRDALVNDYELGNHVFVIPKGCTKIGLSVKSPESLLQNAVATIANSIDGSINLTPEFVAEIKSYIPTDINSDLSAQFYQKGAAPKTATKKKALLCAGQSNAEGRVPIAQLPSYIQFPLAKCNYANSWGATSFSPMQAPTLWAFDAIVYNQMSVVDNEDIYVMKYAVGGTSIDKDGATTMHWSALYEYLNTGDVSLLKRFEQMIRKLTELHGSNFDIRAMLWHQGEGDYMMPAASRYYDNLKYMIAYIRGVVGNQMLPFVCGTISKKSAQYNVLVNDAYRRLASEDPHFYLCNMDDATLLDAYHFDAVSTEKFGKMAYNYLVDAGVAKGKKIPI